MRPSDWRHCARTAFATFAALLAMRAGTARADDATERAPRLTARGRWLLRGSVGGSWSNDDGGGFGALSRWSVYGDPGFVFMLRDGIGLGASVGGGIAERHQATLVAASDSRIRDARAGVSALFDLPLSRLLSLALLPAAGYEREWSSVHSRDTPASTLRFPASLSQPTRPMTQYFRASISADLLLHLSDSVGLGFGPDFWIDVGVSGAGARYQVGLSTTLLLGI